MLFKITFPDEKNTKFWEGKHIKVLLKTSNNESDETVAKKCLSRECSAILQKTEEEFKNWNISLPKQLASLITVFLQLSISTNKYKTNKNNKIKHWRKDKKKY